MRRALSAEPLKVLKQNYSIRQILDSGVTPERVYEMQSQYNKFKLSDSHSFLKKHLTSKVFHDLKQSETSSFSSNLLDCIQSGLQYPDSPIGVYAPDAEAYETFAKLFDPLITDLHGFPPNGTHPQPDFGDYLSVTTVDPHKMFVQSSRIRLLRNIVGFPLAPVMTKTHYQQIETVVKEAFANLQGECEGYYFDEATTVPAKRRNWIKKHMYGTPTSVMKAAKIGRYFPIGRGLFHNLKNKFSVWLNFEDHLRIVSMQQGGNIGQVYRRLIDGLEQLEEQLPFTRCERLGYVTCNPKNIGTGLRASVHIKLLKLPKQRELFQELLDKHHLQVRGTYGEGSSVVGSIYDISNKRTLGVTEIQTVNSFCDGIKEIIRYEKLIKPSQELKFLKFV